MSKPRRAVPWLKTVAGVHHICWYDPATRQTKGRSLRTRDPDEAQARYSVLLAEGQDIFGAAAGKPGDALTCEAILDSYFREHVASKVVDRRRADMIRRHLLEHFGPVPVAGIGPETVSRYCARRAKGVVGGRPAKPSTQRRELVLLIAAINYAVKRRRLDPTAAPFIDLPPNGMPNRRWLTREELERFLREAKKDHVRGAGGRFTIGDPDRLSRLFRFCSIAYETASRKSAVLSLTWFQVDLERRRITLDKAGAVKTKKRRPVVPISDWLYGVLLQAHAERRSEYVLDTPGLLDEAFAGAVARAELPAYVDEANHGRVTPHTLRHTKATHLLQAGVTPFVVAGLLGDTVDTVMRVYGHHCPDHLEEALRNQTAPMRS